VLEIVRKEEEKKPKRLGSVQPNFSSVWHTELDPHLPRMNSPNLMFGITNRI
jgi:hypothetical protein